jgi:hypothetical protein
MINIGDEFHCCRLQWIRFLNVDRLKIRVQI